MSFKRTLTSSRPTAQIRRSGGSGNSDRRRTLPLRHENNSNDRPMQLREIGLTQQRLRVSSLALYGEGFTRNLASLFERRDNNSEHDLESLRRGIHNPSVQRREVQHAEVNNSTPEGVTPQRGRGNLILEETRTILRENPESPMQRRENTNQDRLYVQRRQTKTSDLETTEQQSEYLDSAPQQNPETETDSSLSLTDRGFVKVASMIRMYNMAARSHLPSLSPLREEIKDIGKMELVTSKLKNL